MKYLKTFESITNSIWNIERFKKVWGFEPEDFEDYFVEMVDDLGLNAKVYWFTIGNNSLELKIEAPTEGNSDLHGWFNENIKPRLERIKTELKNKYGIQYSGYQLGLIYQEGDQSFYYKLIWYKTSLLPLSKRNESFEYHGQKYAEEICDQWGVIDLEDLENLFLEFADEGQVLIHPMIVNKEIQVTVHKIWQDLDDSDWLYNPLWDSRFKRIKNQLNRLGLDLNVETKNLKQRFVSVRIFQMTNRNRKHTKTDVITESFEYEGARFIEKICKGWGVEVEDLEDLFVEFSDDGGKVLFSYMEVRDGVIQIVIRDVYKDLDDGEWLYNPIWDRRFRNIKRRLNRMGLDMNVIAKSLNHGRYVILRIFKNSVKESFEMKLGTMDILNKYGLTKDDIEELFLEFSDMGYHIKMLPESISIPTGAFRYRNEYNGLIVFVEGLGAKSHQPEISSLIRKVIKNCEKLGLIMVEPPKKVTQFMRPSNVKFTFKKV